jgi:KDO2-lipid IV(A) lauroyltransferase
MKKNFFRELILFRALKVLIGIARVIPISSLLFAGRFFGAVFFYLNTKRRRIGYANLKRVFAKKIQGPRLRAILKETYANIGMSFFEVLKIPQMNRRYVEKYVFFNTETRFQETFTRPTGAIFATAHFGNWEIANIASALRGRPITVLARTQKMSLFNDLLNRYRASKGCTVITKGFATRRLAETLKHGGVIGMLGDQDAGKKSPMIDLFSIPTSTPRGIAEFSLAFNAPITPAFMVRTRGPYHELAFAPTIMPPAHYESKDEATKHLLREFNKALEQFVTRYPSQWLWMHKRWKSSPYKKIVILDDGKAGHRAQSQAVAELLAKKRASQGVAPQHTVVEEIPIRYKNALCRRLAGVLAPCARLYPQGFMYALKPFLEARSYEAFAHTYADIVISCGASSAPCNLVLKKECLARSICVMKPQGTALGDYDLCIIPAHDRPPRRGNIVETDCVPLRAPKEDSREEIKKIFSLPKEKTIGVLLGGPNAYYAMRAEEMKAFFDELISVAESRGAGLFITTSRRTPEAIVKLAQERFSSKKCVKLLVIANERNIPGIVNAIVTHAHTVVVTQDSVSMISEAVGLQNAVIVHRLTARKRLFNRVNKFERFLENLSRKGYVSIAPEGRLAAVYNSFSCRTAGEVLRDNERIEKALDRVL